MRSVTVQTVIPVLAWLAPNLVLAGQPPVHFEAFGDTFSTAGGDFDACIEPNRVRLPHGAKAETVVQWVGAGRAVLTGEQPTGGHTNYYVTAGPAGWRTGVPHFSAVRARGLYPKIEVSFQSRGRALEFDVLVAPGGNLKRVRFDVSGGAQITPEGDLDAGSDGPILKRPEAWQIVAGKKRLVECSFEIETAPRSSGRRRIGFRTGDYDRSIPLTIDPVVEYTTYLGGDGFDSAQAVAADAAGSAFVTGSSTSSNFPGAPFGSPTEFSFVTKLTPDASAIVYTTVLGSGPIVVPYYSSSPNLDPIPGLALDSDGNVYVSGVTSQANNFPITAGAWHASGVGNGYATKLDAAGQIVYSTYIGGPGWPVSADRVRVRNGVAYLAGTLRQLAFLGTQSAFQRDLHGISDFFVIALAQDGSAALFVTAIGGSGTENLVEMTLDSGGNILLCGGSTSADFPLSPGALNYHNDSNQYTGVMARLTSDGTALLDSSYLGTSNVASIATNRDGSRILLAGNAALPADLVAQGPHHTISLPQSVTQGYVAEFDLSPLRVVWTTDLPVSLPASIGLQVDAQDHIYYTDATAWLSGGAPQYRRGFGITRLSPDGSQLEFFGGGITNGLLAVRPDGRAFAAGADPYGVYFTTDGVLGPTAPVKTAPPPYPYYFYPATGIVARYDLSGMTGENFFVKPPSTSLAVAWRIGEPAAADTTLPLLFNGSAFPLSFVTSNPGLTAVFAAATSTINFNFLPDNSAVVGTTKETVTVADASDPAKSIAIPVSLTIQPEVSFTLDTTQVNIHVRFGQAYIPVYIGIAENFGSEYFGINAVSLAPSWLYTYAYQDAPQHARLFVNVAALEPGTYDGTITLSIGILVGGQQIVNVHYVVDPPATIQLSATTLTLHVVKGQLVQPVTANVTGSVPGVPFTLFAGGFTWLQSRAIGTVTPGIIEFTADSAAAVPGYYSFAFFVYGETGERIQGVIFVDVSSGAPLDVTPSSITWTYYRNGQYVPPAPFVSFTSPAPTAVTFSADQPWVIQAAGGGTTPFGVSFNFDPTLAEGVYHGNIVAVAGAARVTVPITFNLYDTPYLVFAATPFTFNYQIGGPLPPAQTLQITSPTLNPAGFASSATNFPTFLKVSLPYGRTPATLTLTADPTGLLPGTYTTGLWIYAAYGTNGGSTIIPVTLTVTADANAPIAVIAGVVDAANYLGGTVSPGEIMALFGSQLGPETLVSAQLDSSSRFPLSLEGTTVYFDDIPAPIIYTSAGQAAVVAPFEIAGKATTSVTVSTNNRQSAPIVMPVSAANPAIFTANASGFGQPAALRVDASGAVTIASADNPVAAGEFVVLYGTGLGSTTPVIPNGAIVVAPLPTLNAASIRVWIGGKEAEVLYAGPAPSLIAGAAQINVRVPADLGPGIWPVLLIADGNPSQPGVTLASR